MKHKRNKILSLLLTVAILFSLCSISAYADESDFAGGAGTAEDPYLIATTDQLAKATETGKYYLLTNDLTVTWSVPCSKFSGTFDGGGHTISGLKTSLFEKVGAGGNVDIKNLNLVGYNSTSQRGMVFGTSASNSSTITLNNIHVTIKGGKATGSGLAGEQGNSPLTIENCSVVVKSGASISGGDQTGGLVRHLRGKVNMKDSFVYIEEGASIISTGNQYGGAGGLAGVLSHATGGSPQITNCYVINKGTISNKTSTASNAAGAGALVGTNWSNNANLTVKNTYVYNDGTISSGVDGCAGILVGHMKLYNSNTTVRTITMDNLVAYTNGVPMVGKVEAGIQGEEGSTKVGNASEITSKIDFIDSAWVQNASISPAYDGISKLAGVPYLKMEETAELTKKFVEVNKNRDDDAVTELESAYSGYTLTGVANGGASLTENTDYTFDNDELTINNSYIKTLGTGTTALTLTFNKGLPVNFYIHVVEKPVVTLQQAAAGGSATFEDGTTDVRDAVAGAEVKVIAEPSEGYVLKGWKVGDVDQADSAKEEWNYTVPNPVVGNITITPVFELNNNYVKFTLKDENSASADMSGTKVTIKQSESTIAEWTWNSMAAYHKALGGGTYQYKVEKDGYITENGSFEVSYSGSPVPVALTIGKYYVGPYATEQQLTASGSGNDIYTVSYEINKVRAVSGQLTVTIPTGVTLMDGENPAVNGDVNVTAGADIQVGSSTLNGDQLIITWAVDTGVTPHYVDTLDGPKTILSFNVKPTGKKTIEATGNVADNNPNGADTDTKPLTVEVGVDILKYTVTFNANGHGTAPAAQSEIAYEGKATEPTAPTEAGYTFGGWYKEAGCTNPWNFETDKVTADTTLYAKWTANTYTVTFNANGHGTAPAAQSGIAYEGKASAPTAPTAAGYTFGGWYKEAECTNPWNFETDKVTADTTLYAKWTANSTSGGGGGSYIPPVQKPVIDNNNNAKTELSGDGTKLTIKAEEGYKVVDVIVNGVSKGAVDTLTGLKTGDKVVVVTEEIETEPTIEEVKAELGTSSLVARSQAVTLKNGKKAIKITWYDQNGNEVKFDGVEIYRSTKRNTGYGKKPIFVSKTGVYYNTSIKPGTKYYYRVRGFREIDGQMYYTNWSLKAIRTW